MKCPSCNADITYPVGAKVAQCEYCDSQIYLDDGSRNLCITDEAELAKVNLLKELNDYNRTQDAELQKEQERNKKKSQRWIITSIIFHFITPLSALISRFFGVGRIAGFFILFFMIFFAPIFLGALKPNNASRHGKGFFIVLFYITMISSMAGFICVLNYFQSKILG